MRPTLSTATALPFALTLLGAVAACGPGAATRAATTTPPAAAATSSAAPMSPEAAAYLAVALDTLRAVVLGSDTLPWARIADSARIVAAGAERPADTYGAIFWTLQRVNKHSFLQATLPGAVSRVLPGRIGYVHVPQRGGAGPGLADSLQRGLAALDSAGVCGWIVDLRANGGGNMWPMLAGIGPLLGDSLVGAFGTAPGAARWYYARGVSGMLQASGKLDTAATASVAPVRLRDPAAPVAVLLDGATASSGEAVAVAFLGRPRTRSFGEPTAGLATANRGSRLPDGANMVVTSGRYVDRLRRQTGETLTPDVRVPAARTPWPFATDTVARTAAAWLRGEAACSNAGD